MAADPWARSWLQWGFVSIGGMGMFGMYLSSVDGVIQSSIHFWTAAVVFGLPFFLLYDAMPAAPALLLRGRARDLVRMAALLTYLLLSIFSITLAILHGFGSLQLIFLVPVLCGAWACLAVARRVAAGET